MDRKKLSNLLKELRNLAEEIDGDEKSKSLTRHYNNFLSIAKKDGLIEDDGLFTEANEKTTASEIFVDAALLSKYLISAETERQFEVTIESDKIEEMEHKIRIKELAIEEKRLAQQEAELAMEAENLERQAEEIRKKRIEIKIEK
ncbi:TPA: hypothetical protein DCR49_06710 [Candidatus Delongbacteria bacterium]|nr:hypothetical protein [Candidatus Delongbacteria bacterium]